MSAESESDVSYETALPGMMLIEGELRHKEDLEDMLAEDVYIFEEGNLVWQWTKKRKENSAILI